MNSEEILKSFGSEIYFYIFKKVGGNSASDDIFQNVFYKVHKNHKQLLDKAKVKSWVFSIVRNEISNHFNSITKFEEIVEEKMDAKSEIAEQFCCFEKFIKNLPENYRAPIELAYLKGLKQEEISRELNISVANVKVRINRAKEILKNNFHDCCKFEFDNNGKLVGQSDCQSCSTI